MTSVAVLYIYWGSDNHRSFMKSYQKHFSAWSHDLFTLIPGPGMNVGAYLDAAKVLDHDYVCCCTAYTEFLTDGWLAKMMGAALQEGVGAVDVMGSYESRSQWGYDGYASSDFPPFPNPHLRVVCLLIRRELLLDLAFAPMTSKIDTLRFESGKDGLPSRLKARGLKQVIVGADGKVYDERLWPVSNTFRLGDQSNLIAHDKHSRGFAASPVVIQEWLSRIAYNGGGSGG